jgi:hypothetical protein
MASPVLAGKAGDQQMCSDWNSAEEPDSDGWRGDDATWSPELSFGDADAWRGDSPTNPEAWRGTMHLEDWPVWNAGPEYHMWKRLEEKDRRD